jgi:TAP-like protein
MHRALNGSRMITLDGVRAHGVYSGQDSPCVKEAVNAYLNTGHLYPHTTSPAPASQTTNPNRTLGRALVPSLFPSHSHSLPIAGGIPSADQGQ